ncbi:amidohydrolase family protein [Streptomyces sp. NC-S4]
MDRGLPELGADATEADLDHRFALMDRAGIDLQVLSVAPQSPHLPGEAEAVAPARAANDSYAARATRFADRFRVFAARPLPHVDATLREVTRAPDDLGAAGVGVTTTVLGRTLADPLFHPVHEELDRRGTVLCFGAGRLVLGTDFPYENDEVFVRSVDHVSETGLAREGAAAILDTNAADLLGLSRRDPSEKLRTLRMLRALRG